MVYGAVRSSAPRFAPSSLNWTPTTPTLSLAFADTVTVPVTDAPAAGAVIATVGGVRSSVVNVQSPEIAGGVASLLTVTVTAADVVALPDVSRATAVSVCVPLATAVVSHET